MAQGRRVRRVVRRIDTWSVCKVGLLFSATLAATVILAGILLWAGARSLGAIGNVEKFMRDIGFEGFRLLPGQLLKAFVAVGVVFTLVSTGFFVVLAVLYNLISDVVGGVQLVVLEEVRTGVAEADDLDGAGPGQRLALVDHDDAADRGVSLGGRASEPGAELARPAARSTLSTAPAVGS